eukprot:symbB.v1.2.024364.t1/scaffold2300.1/size82923/3
MASLVGGLSRGALLEHLSWITLENQEEQRFLGMRFVCIAEGPLLSPAFNPDWSGIDRCIPLSALACAGPDPVACEGRAWDPNCHGHELRATNWEKAQCSTCRNAGIALLAPILISTATYLKVMHGVGIRLSGKDSAINKVSVFFAGVLGSIANLSLMATYFLTCIRTLQRAEIFLEPMMGPGFACVLLATIFKLSASLLQLGLALEVAVNDDDSSEPFREGNLRSRAGFWFLMVAESIGVRITFKGKGMWSVVFRIETSPLHFQVHIRLQQRQNGIEGGIVVGSVVSFTLELNKSGKPQAREAKLEAEKSEQPLEEETGPKGADVLGKVFKGTVKSFNISRGFGFLTCRDLIGTPYAGRDIYVSQTQVPGNRPLSTGHEVDFVLSVNQQGQPQGKDLRMTNTTPELDYLGELPTAQSVGDKLLKMA